MKHTFTHRGLLLGFAPVIIGQIESGDPEVAATNYFYHLLGNLAEFIVWLSFCNSMPILFVKEMIEPLEFFDDDDDDLFTF